MLSIEQITQKWVSGMAQAGPAYEQGIQAVTTSPTAKAADAADRYLAGVSRAVESGRFQSRLRNISLESWKTSAIKKGKTRLQTGAEAGRERFNKAMADVIPQIERIRASLPPRGDIGSNINRAVMMMQGLHDWAAQRS